jgi:phosphatidylserine decarboxylase
VTFERINFWITNRIPRRRATRLIGRLSRIEHPLFCRLALAVWQWFGGDLLLHEARKTRFASVHDCFIRELKEGARPIDSHSDALISPCDGIVMACGRIDDRLLIQAKGRSYTLDDLLIHPDLVARHRQGAYVTLRLTSTMYHRFHAPDAGEINEVIYVAGDTWNVNGPALARIPALYCKNERAILPMWLASGEPLTLVPVAAILVGSIHLHCLDVLLNLQYRGPNRISCRGAWRRGDELGYFHHGSTIVVLASGTIDVCENVRDGSVVRMGQPQLMRNRTRE